MEARPGEENNVLVASVSPISGEEGTEEDMEEDFEDDEEGRRVGEVAERVEAEE